MPKESGQSVRRNSEIEYVPFDSNCFDRFLFHSARLQWEKMGRFLLREKQIPAWRPRSVSVTLLEYTILARRKIPESRPHSNTVEDYLLRVLLFDVISNR